MLSKLNGNKEKAKLLHNVSLSQTLLETLQGEP